MINEPHTFIGALRRYVTVTSVKINTHAKLNLTLFDTV